MLEEQLLEEFAARLRAEAEERLAELDADTPLAPHTALADIMLGYMEEAGLVTEHELCPYEDTAGRSRCRVIGYALPEDSARLEIFTAQFVPQPETYLAADDLSRLTGRAARFFGYAASRDLARFAGNDAAANAARHIADELQRIEDVRVHVLTNGLVRDRSVNPIEIADRAVEFSVVDLERLFRASRETVTRDRIEIDFTELIGRPIACLEMKPRPREYETYLVIPKKVDRIDISKVALTMKLTLVEPAKLTEFVPLIARYSNTQNVIQVSDLLANNDFHIRIEQLSEKVWCPGEEERWFYERARGAYQVAAARYGTTPARHKEFDRECPKTNRSARPTSRSF